MQEPVVDAGEAGGEYQRGRESTEKAEAEDELIELFIWELIIALGSHHERRETGRLTS